MELSLTSIKKLLGRLLGRYHIVLFFIVSLGGLAAALFMLNQVIEASAQANGYTSNANNVGFDEVTIEKLRSLKEANQDTEKLQLSGRVNPFVE